MESTRTNEPSGRQTSLDAISRVIAYVAGQWYETEYGKLELADRWYQPGLHFLEAHLGRVAKEVRS